MIDKHFEELVTNRLGFELSDSQNSALQAFIEFFLRGNEESLFLLKGYAGTGKTSLVAGIVNTLIELKYKVVLLAPTGRAAKVLTGYSSLPAFTIHKKIYRQKDAKEGEGFFKLGFNPNHDTLYFVDESSMISNTFDDSNFGSGRLMDDLFEFVYNGNNNRLILIGDVAQLPPVGLPVSPALDAEYLKASYGMEVHEGLLTEIMRQATQSGILFNATLIRAMLYGINQQLQMVTKGFSDVRRITGGELIEELESCYDKFGEDETMVLCRSNKRANRYNEGIRRTILYREEAFCRGDRIMIVKNNYFWGKKADDDDDFIANGEIANVEHIGKYKDIYGHHFVKADLCINALDNIDAWIMLDSLSSDMASLTSAENKQFYRIVEADYADIPSAKKRFEKVRENEFYNALQVKFAYAITCHKAQGGQWDVIFIDQGYIPDEQLGDEYWRWLYTAVTRARKRLYFVNFKDDLFEM